jgi:2-C-methyl-D-erythritol 4-phosphate cytidylyltransferase
MFRHQLLLNALFNANPTTTTDEASAIEQQGLMPQIVECGSHNFKITYPEDIKRAESLIHQRLEGENNV